MLGCVVSFVCLSVFVACLFACLVVLCFVLVVFLWCLCCCVSVLALMYDCLLA